jgi:chromosome segregation ATPase
MRKSWLIGAVLALATGACAGSQGEQVRDARMEQAEAQADSREQAVNTTEDTREEAIEQRADATKQRLDDTNPPAADAQKELVDVNEERATYQSQAKAKLDKLGVRLDEATQKISVLGSKAPTALKGELATTTRQYRSLERDVISLDQTPPSSWESTTEAIDERISTLDSRVSELSDGIEEQS